jgi:hypothetical protein
MADNGDSGPLENPGPNKKKAMSSNLLNLKVRTLYLGLGLPSQFMQRGRDAEVAAKLQQQQVKEVSDQQWHLSVIQNLDSL